MVSYITAALGLILTALVLMHQIAVWQRKEYRWDRFRAELMALYRRPTLRWSFKGFTRPRPTAKAIVITAVAAAILALVFRYLRAAGFSGALAWLLLLLLTPLVAAAATALGNTVGDIQKRRVIQAAQHHRQALRHLTVIGITGSYGKTSTKHFLHHMLSNGTAEVVSSADRRNEAFVIAQDMLSRLRPSTKTYIVEMAAYQRGEITRLASIAQPTIGVVTAIGNQHLALFGSLKAITQAKWELVESLPPDGVAVLNAGDPAIQVQAAQSTGRRIWYSTRARAEVYVSEVDLQLSSFSATFHIQGTAQRVAVPLAGEGYVASAVAAAAAAHAVGTAAPDIFARLASLTPIPHTMVVQTNSRGATIIDDSYSANEDGVLMAIRHLTRFPHPRKVVVLRPLIELGGEASRVHAAVGAAVADARAELFLYDAPGANDIERAATIAGLTNIHRLSAPKRLAAAVREATPRQTACLLENRLPDIVQQAALA